MLASCPAFLFSGWTGLRGAMAFALALQAVHDLPNNHGEIIFTATTAIVVLTVSSSHQSPTGFDWSRFGLQKLDLDSWF